VVIIHRARLVAHDSVSALTARVAGGAVVRSPEATRLREELARRGIEAGEDDGRLRVQASAEVVGEVAAEAGVVLHELRGESASLEEVFLELTGGAPS